MRSGTRFVLAALLWGLVLGGAEARPAPTSKACLECHGVEGRRPAGQAADGTSVYLDDWARSVHSGLDCVDCHKGIKSLPHETPVPRADCSACHQPEVDSYAKSAHGVHVAAADSLAPSCAICHDPHSILPGSDPESILHRSRVTQVCTRCHADHNGAGGRDTAVPHPAQSYARGAHARAQAAGKVAAATCGDCHDSHAALRSQDPQSPVYRQHIPATCGKCHQQEFAAYEASVHGQAVARGSSDSPVCATCHGEHAVLPLAEPGQTMVVASETCESCHDNPALARRYDLPQRAVWSYEDSYHGRAARGGLAKAAGCTSCHGVHRILARSDPASSINPGNLVQTCSTCHPGATPTFAASYAHAPRTASAGDRAAGWVRRIYLWLIGLVIGGMLLHNLVLFAHDMRQRWREHKTRPGYERLNRSEVAQHWMLLVTFSLLVITGFALKYPDTFWARALAAVGLEEGVRRFLHRVAAVGMIVASAYHCAYLLSRRGREQLGHMTPRLVDMRQAITNVAYYLGKAPRPPRFDRFRYIEKAEYWALIWGTVVMVTTGLILWFPEHLSGPKWLVRVAEAVHLYEAWLAFLAIVVWHLFFTVFRPGVFPLSFTFITGRIDAEEMAHEHPEDHARVHGRRGLPPGAPGAGLSPQAPDASARPKTDAASPPHVSR